MFGATREGSKRRSRLEAEAKGEERERSSGGEGKGKRKAKKEEAKWLVSRKKGERRGEKVIENQFENPCWTFHINSFLSTPSSVRFIFNIGSIHFIRNLIIRIFILNQEFITKSSVTSVFPINPTVYRQQSVPTGSKEQNITHQTIEWTLVED